MASTADIEKAAAEEVKADAEAVAADQIRRTIADVYTFVRSCDINKTVASFTLDHYIDEAKRRIKAPRILRSASDPSKGVGTRPAQLEALEKLEESFNKNYKQFEEMAKKADTPDEPTPEATSESSA